MKPPQLFLTIVVAASAGGFLHYLTSRPDHRSDYATASSRGGADVRSLSEILSERNPLRFRSDYLRYLNSLTKANARDEAIRLWALSLSLEETKELQKLFGFAWGSLEGEIAVDFIYETESVAKISALSQALAGWANTDPEAAKDWVESKLKPAERLLFRWALVDGWARHDPDSALDYVLSLELVPGRERLMKSIALEQVRQNPQTAALWIQGLPEGSLRVAAIEETSRNWSLADPQATANWALTDLTSPEEVTQALNTFLPEWTRNDPDGPADVLNQIPEGFARDQGIATYIRAHPDRDLQLVSSWASEITDPVLRQDTLFEIAEEELDRNPEGTEAWLPESGLDQDRINRLPRNPIRR